MTRQPDRYARGDRVGLERAHEDVHRELRGVAVVEDDPERLARHASLLHTRRVKPPPGNKAAPGGVYDGWTRTPVRGTLANLRRRRRNHAPLLEEEVEPPGGGGSAAGPRSAHAHTGDAL